MFMIIMSNKYIITINIMVLEWLSWLKLFYYNLYIFLLMCTNIKKQFCTNNYSLSIK